MPKAQHCAACDIWSHRKNLQLQQCLEQAQKQINEQQFNEQHHLPSVEAFCGATVTCKISFRTERMQKSFCNTLLAKILAYRNPTILLQWILNPTYLLF